MEVRPEGERKAGFTEVTFSRGGVEVRPEGELKAGFTEASAAEAEWKLG